MLTNDKSKLEALIEVLMEVSADNVKICCKMLLAGDSTNCFFLNEIYSIKEVQSKINNLLIDTVSKYVSDQPELISVWEEFLFIENLNELLSENGLLKAE